MRNEATGSNLIHYTDIYLKRMRTLTKNLLQESCFPAQYLSPRSPNTRQYCRLLNPSVQSRTLDEMDLRKYEARVTCNGSVFITSTIILHRISKTHSPVPQQTELTELSTPLRHRNLKPWRLLALRLAY
jgi:hypothetical protein